MQVKLALLIAFIAIVLGLCLRTGAVGVRGASFERENQPVIYWVGIGLLVLIMVLLVGALFMAN